MYLREWLEYFFLWIVVIVLLLIAIDSFSAEPVLDIWKDDRVTLYSN